MVDIRDATPADAHGLAARALLIITPGGGFEGFFTEAGVPADAGVPAPLPGPAEIARVLAAAPRYGAELALPPDPEGTPRSETVANDARA